MCPVREGAFHQTLDGIRAGGLDENLISEHTPPMAGHVCLDPVPQMHQRGVTRHQVGDRRPEASNRVDAKSRVAREVHSGMRDALDVALRVVRNDENGHSVLEQSAGGKVNGLS
jgi:hypothetical protein